jgi:hypothetical protein
MLDFVTDIVISSITVSHATAIDVLVVILLLLLIFFLFFVLSAVTLIDQIQKDTLSQVTEFAHAGEVFTLGLNAMV